MLHASRWDLTAGGCGDGRRRPVADSGAVRAGIRTLLVPALPPRLDNGVADVLKPYVTAGIDE